MSDKDEIEYSHRMLAPYITMGVLIVGVLTGLIALGMVIVDTNERDQAREQKKRQSMQACLETNTYQECVCWIESKCEMEKP